MALKRPRLPLPEDVRQALELSDLMGAFEARPDFQRDGYIGWIVESRREFMRRKRIGQLLEELEAGNSYLGKEWSGARKRR